MEATHQDLQTRHPLQNYPQEPYHADPNSKTGIKRLFSNREPRLLDNSDDDSENYEDEPAEEEAQSGKRYRPSDWPLTSTTRSGSPSARGPLQNRNGSNSPSFRRRSRSQARPSKFMEGSMNDRVSHKPPIPYLGDEDSRDKFEREENENARGRKLAQPRKLMNHSNTSAIGSSADRSEVSTSRHSGIFRFGKSLAASFNPSNWKIWSKQPQQDEETAQQKTLRERRDKAESMYRELKKSGHFHDSTFGPPMFREPEEKRAIPTKHDSGVEFNEPRARTRMSAEISREEKRMGRVFLEPPQLQSDGASPVSNSQDSVRKSRFHFKKPSLSNIRKSQYDSETGSNAPSSGDYHKARRIPSRKDLQKQQKLVKRVSDLEGKLEAARRQLCDVMGEPVPSQPAPRVGRARFVPGALSTLPSERLLSGYISTDAGMSDDEHLSQIGQAVTTDYKEENTTFLSGARFGSQPAELEAPARASQPTARFDKPLPRNPGNPEHDRVIQSIEMEAESVKLEEQAAEMEPPVVKAVASHKGTNSQPSNAPSGLSPLDFLDSNFEEEEESAKRPNSFDTKVAHISKSKKRKSWADHNGASKQARDEDSDADSEIKKSKHSKQNVTRHPRKLQKTNEESSLSGPPAKPNSVQNSVPVNNHNHHPLIPRRKISTSSSAAPSRASKTKIPAKKGRQSFSPPPSGSFTGLVHTTTSPPSQPERSAHGSRTESGAATPSATADRGDVPPMPPLPKTVKLASGEVVSTDADTHDDGAEPRKATACKLVKARRVETQRSSKKSGDRGTGLGPGPGPGPGPGVREEYEWPADVF